MLSSVVKYQLILFLIMFLVAFFLNPMNILAFRLSDLYPSTTLIYSSLFMASNMIWAHEVVHYLAMNHINIYVVIIGIVMSIIMAIILRTQLFVTDKEWMKRMIPHHSTALTTSNIKLQNSDNSNVKNLARNIIYTQENEIDYMKSLL
jgi:hypothetical protein